MRTKAMKSACAAVTMTVFTLVCCRPAVGQASLKTALDRKERVAALEKTIPVLMETAGIPGMSIALIRDGEVVWSRGFGIKNSKTGEPVKDDTVFEAASLTKPFFAYLVMKFVEDGKLDLDKPLVTYAPMVIEPLQMKDSSMVWREAYETQAAVGHDMLSGTRGEFRKRTQAHAAASLYTTASDYARFVAALMNNRGLTKSTVEKMLTSQIEVEKNVSWSLGFGLERTPNGKAFWQWGDYGIFRSYIVAYPDKKIGVVYLTNSQNGLSIGQEILDLAIGGGEDYGLAYLKYELPRRRSALGQCRGWSPRREGGVHPRRGQGARIQARLSRTRLDRCRVHRG